MGVCGSSGTFVGILGSSGTFVGFVGISQAEAFWILLGFRKKRLCGNSEKGRFD